jgi:hypothetical protein
MVDDGRQAGPGLASRVVARDRVKKERDSAKNIESENALLFENQ